MGSYLPRILPQNPLMRADYKFLKCLLRDAYLRVNCNLFRIDISEETNIEPWEEKGEAVEEAVS